MNNKPTYEELQQRAINLESLVVEHKHTLEKLRMIERDYSSIVESIPGIVFRCAWDNDYTLFIMNEYAERVTGYPASDFINNAVRTYESIIHLEDAEYASRTSTEAIESDKLWDIEYRIHHKDGSIRWVHEKGRAVRDEDGNVLFCEGVVLDITRRKLSEEALRNAHDELEKRVQERTFELEQKTIGLEESNIALKVLMKQRETDKKELEENILFNVNKLVEPYLKKLKQITSDNNHKVYLEVIESNLHNIIKPFAPGLSAYLLKLTPAEIQIADLIRHGKATKDIASFLNLSPSTIAAHRQNIRKKLALTNKEINLQTALTAISQ